MDERGNPVAGAAVFAAPAGSGSSLAVATAQTDLSGSFSMTAPVEGPTDLAAFADGWAPGRAYGVLSTELDPDPMELVARGDAPQLSALRLHNGTVYRWNRACYGVADNVAHLRLENRVLPAGPGGW